MFTAMGYLHKVQTKHRTELGIIHDTFIELSGYIGLRKLWLIRCFLINHKMQ